MEQEYTIKLKKVIKQFNMKTIYLPENGEDIKICSPDVQRPGLALSGFFEGFEDTRIEVIGRAEHAFLESLTAGKRDERIRAFMEMRPVAVVFSTDLPVFDEMIKYAEEFEVPVLSSEMRTSGLIAAIIGFLHVELAPRITRHGVLVEVYGDGLLLLGSCSETTHQIHTNWKFFHTL